MEAPNYFAETLGRQHPLYVVRVSTILDESFTEIRKHSHTTSSVQRAALCLSRSWCGLLNHLCLEQVCIPSQASCLAGALRVGARLARG